MLERVEGADTKVTFLLKSETAKYIRVASAGQDKTQSKFIEDVLDSYGRVVELDMEKLESVLYEVSAGSIYPGEGNLGIAGAVKAILGIFGIEKAGMVEDEETFKTGGSHYGAQVSDQSERGD